MKIFSLSGLLLRDYDGADLRGANLRGANLCGANLGGDTLCGANLDGANLRGASLYGADLRGANLYGANLCGADLYGANLRGANLYGADLRGANLRGANLCGASLYGADLCGARDGELSIAQTRILPDGALIGWKKCKNDVLVKLRIPENAKRSHAYGRKCRAEFVEVLEVIGSSIGISQHDGITSYSVGQTVTADKWCDDYTKECAGGIHFFITRLEAENY